MDGDTNKVIEVVKIIMSDFILELLSEEIPSRMQKQASEYLLREFRQHVEGAGLEVGQIQSFIQRGG